MTDPDGSSLLGQLLLIALLTAINAFFAAAEIAVVSLNRNKMEAQAEEGDKKAKRLVNLLKDPSNFLATIQVGITFAGFLSSASAATTLSTKLSPVFGGASWAKEVSVVIVTIILSFVSLVFGELYPKRVALQKAEVVAKAAVGPINAVGLVLRPFVALLSFSTSLLAKLTPMKFDDEEPKMTREEMVHMIESGQKYGAIESDEFEMMEGIISLHTKMAREVMVPRTDALMVNIRDDNDKNIDIILGESYSRIPVYDDDKDKVIGIVHIKNLLKAARQFGFSKVRLGNVMQEPLFVPETIWIDDLLYELKRTQNQMAILLDEYGGVVGIVTLEDLLEEIVGEIDDESDEVETLSTRLSENEYIVQGRMPLDDFNEIFHTELESKDVDTIAGYMLTELGTIPNEGEQRRLDMDKVCLITEKVEGSRLIEIRVKVLQQTEPVEEETKEENQKD